MAEPVVNPEIIVTPVVTDPPQDVVEFDKLPENIRKFVDQERTKASTTAREKAKRDALNDPEVVSAIKTRIETEANLTAEQKVANQMKEVAQRENRMDAKEILVANGIVGEQLEGVLKMVVVDSHDDTVARANEFITLFKASVASEAERTARDNLRTTPKPQNTPTPTKAFKDMNWKEREELMNKDPKRYERELNAIRSKI